MLGSADSVRLFTTYADADRIVQVWRKTREVDAPPPLAGAIRALGSSLQSLQFVCGIRSIRADDLWLSGAYGRDTVGIHFTWRRDEPGVRALLPQIEAALAHFNVRPHWGKVFTMDAATLAARYARWAEFAELRSRWDPRGVFRNAQLAGWGFPAPCGALGEADALAGNMSRSATVRETDLMDRRDGHPGKGSRASLAAHVVAPVAAAAVTATVTAAVTATDTANATVAATVTATVTATELRVAVASRPLVRRQHATRVGCAGRAGTGVHAEHASPGGRAGCASGEPH